MSRRFVFAMTLATLAICTVPQAANACRTTSSETYVFLEQAPAFVPEDAELFEVEVPENLGPGWSGWQPRKVHILQRTPRQWGFDKLMLDPGLQTSCSRWGVTTGTAYVVGKLKREADGSYSLAAIQMRSRTFWLPR